MALSPFRSLVVTPSVLTLALPAPTFVLVWWAIGVCFVVEMSRRAVRLAALVVPSGATPDVLLDSDGFEILGIDAETITAEVVDRQSIRYWPVGQLISDSMDELRAVVVEDTPIITIR